MRLFVLVVGVVGFVALLGSVDAAQAARRQAVLIGVEQYQHPKLGDLKYACDDVIEFASVLRAAGFEVILLTDEAGREDPKLAPTRANVNDAIARGLDACQDKQDVFLLGLAGHGIQFNDGDGAFFCPVDGKPFKNRKGTLVSIDQVYRLMEDSYAGTKLMLIDACRNNPGAPRSRGITSDTANTSQRGVSVLFGCGPGQRSYEHDEFKHGVMFHHVLKVCRESTSRGLTWYGLIDRVSDGVQTDADKLLAVKQQPQFINNLAGSIKFLQSPLNRIREAAEVLQNASNFSVEIVASDMEEGRAINPASLRYRKDSRGRYDLRSSDDVALLAGNGEVKVTQFRSGEHSLERDRGALLELGAQHSMTVSNDFGGLATHYRPTRSRQYLATHLVAIDAVALADLAETLTRCRFVGHDVIDAIQAVQYECEIAREEEPTRSFSIWVTASGPAKLLRIESSKEGKGWRIDYDWRHELTERRIALQEPVNSVCKPWVYQLRMVQPSLLIGKAAPPVTFPQLYGGEVDIGSYYGKKPVIIQFWRTTCPPCQQLLQHIQGIVRPGGGPDVAYFPVHEGDPLDVPIGISEFFRKLELDEFTLIAKEDETGGVSSVLKQGFHAVPYVVLIGPKGRVQKILRGYPYATASLSTQLVNDLKAGRDFASEEIAAWENAKAAWEVELAELRRLLTK
ncbi:MAG: caspase family protein [Planctomycetota bacterium]